MYKKILVAMIATMFALAAVGAIAGGEEVVEEKMVIALKSDDFELHETDISHLAVGDAETIVTDSGKTIDLLRTEDGVEIYVDGELLDIGGGYGDLHEAHEVHESHEMVYKTIEIECESEDDCEKNVWISDGESVDLGALHDGDHKVIMLHEGDEDVDVEILKEKHAEKIIIIKKKTEDSI